MTCATETAALLALAGAGPGERGRSCRSRKVIVSGIGKAGPWARSSPPHCNTGTPAFFVHPAEAVHGDSGMVRPGDLVIALSNSGETDELLAFLDIVQDMGVPIIAITGKPESSLAKMAVVTLDSGVEREADPHNLAPTTSAVAQMAVGDALVVSLMIRRGFGPEDFKRFHPGGALGRRLSGQA